MEKVSNILKELIKISNFDDKGNPLDLDIVPLKNDNKLRSDSKLFLKKPVQVLPHTKMEDEDEAEKAKEKVVQTRSEANLPGFKEAWKTPVFYCFEPNDDLYNTIKTVDDIKKGKIEGEITPELRNKLAVAKDTLNVLKGLKSNLFSRKKLRLIEKELVYGFDNVNTYFSTITTIDVNTVVGGSKINRGEDTYSKADEVPLEDGGSQKTFKFDKVYMFFLESSGKSSEFLMNSAEKYFKKKGKEVVKGKIAKIKFSKGEDAVDYEQKQRSKLKQYFDDAAKSVKKHLVGDHLIYKRKIDIIKNKDALNLLFHNHKTFIEYEVEYGEVVKLTIPEEEFTVEYLLDLVEDNFPVKIEYKYFNVGKKIGGQNVTRLVSKYGIDPHKKYGPRGKMYAKDIAKDINNAIRSIGTEGEEGSKLLIVDDNIQSGTDYRRLFKEILKINSKCKGNMAGLVLYPLSPVFSSKRIRKS